MDFASGHDLQGEYLSRIVECAKNDVSLSKYLTQHHGRDVRETADVRYPGKSEQQLGIDTVKDQVSRCFAKGSSAIRGLANEMTTSNASLTSELGDTLLKDVEEKLDNADHLQDASSDEPYAQQYEASSPPVRAAPSSLQANGLQVRVGSYVPALRMSPGRNQLQEGVNEHMSGRGSMTSSGSGSGRSRQQRGMTRSEAASGSGPGRSRQYPGITEKESSDLEDIAKHVAEIERRLNQSTSRLPQCIKPMTDDTVNSRPDFIMMLERGQEVPYPIMAADYGLDPATFAVTTFGNRSLAVKRTSRNGKEKKQKKTKEARALGSATTAPGVLIKVQFEPHVSSFTEPIEHLGVLLLDNRLLSIIPTTNLGVLIISVPLNLVKQLMLLAFCSTAVLRTTSDIDEITFLGRTRSIVVKQCNRVASTTGPETLAEERLSQHIQEKTPLPNFPVQDSDGASSSIDNAVGSAAINPVGIADAFGEGASRTLYCGVPVEESRSSTSISFAADGSQPTEPVVAGPVTDISLPSGGSYPEVGPDLLQSQSQTTAGNDSKVQSYCLVDPNDCLDSHLETPRNRLLITLQESASKMEDAVERLREYMNDPNSKPAPYLGTMNLHLTEIKTLVNNSLLPAVQRIGPSLEGIASIFIEHVPRKDFSIYSHFIKLLITHQDEMCQQSDRDDFKGHHGKLDIKAHDNHWHIPCEQLHCLLTAVKSRMGCTDVSEDETAGLQTARNILVNVLQVGNWNWELEQVKNFEYIPEWHGRLVTSFTVMMWNPSERHHYRKRRKLFLFENCLLFVNVGDDRDKPKLKVKQAVELKYVEAGEQTSDGKEVYIEYHNKHTYIIELPKDLQQASLQMLVKHIKTLKQELWDGPANRYFRPAD